MVWSAAVILVFGIAIWLWASSRYMVRASQGRRIGVRPGTALILVDLQEAVWTDSTYPATTRARVEAAIAREASLAKRDGLPVIALRHEWSGLGPRLVAHLTDQAELVPNSKGSALAAPFAELADHVVVKRVEDGFETGELDALLEVLDIGHLRIAGRDGTRAVARTVQGGLNRGYEITLVVDAIATSKTDRFGTVAEALTSQGAMLTRG